MPTFIPTGNRHWDIYEAWIFKCGNFCCSTLYLFTEYLSLIALLRLFCQLQSLFFVSPYTGQLPDLLHFHSDVIQSLVSGHVFLHIHNFKFTFVSLFWIFEVYFVIHDPPMQYIQVWCQIKDVIALIATLILQQQLLNYLFLQTTLDWLFYHSVISRTRK